MPYVISLTGSAGDSAALGMFSFKGQAQGTTVEAWIKTSTPTAQAVLAGSGEGGFDFYIAGNQLFFSWTLPDKTQQSFQSDPIPGTLADSCWHHVAVSFSTNYFAGTTEFYLDGNLLTRRHFLEWKLLRQQQLQVQAGAPSSREPSLGTFNGALTDLRIWDTAQAEEDIRARYRGNINPQATSLVGYWPLSQGALQNQSPGGVFMTLGGSATVEFDTAPAWYPLSELVCNVPSEPFPVFTGEAATAYQNILSRLGITDLRARYLDMAWKVSSNQSDIDNLTPDPSVPVEVWRAVIRQLDREMTAVASVRLYFVQVREYLDRLHAQNQDVLSSVGTLVDIQEVAPVSGSFLGFASRLVALVGSVGGNAGLGLTLYAGVLGAMASLQAAGSASSNDAFEVEYANLWLQLDKNFNALHTQADLQEQAILQDWGRLRATLSSRSIQEIMTWQVTETDELVTKMLPFCQQYYAQLLVPIVWRLFVLIPNNFDGRGIDSPSQCGCLHHSVPAQAWSNIQGMVYVVARDGELDDFPSQALMDLLFQLPGINATTFFTGGFARMSVSSWNCCNWIHGCTPGEQGATAQRTRLHEAARHPAVQAFLKEVHDALRARPPVEAASALGPPAGSKPATMLFLNGEGFEERHVFYRGTDNTLSHVWCDAQGLHSDQWTGGGDPLAVGAPAAVASSSGQHLFYRSAGGTLEHVWFDGAFHRESWAGGVGQAPLAASDPAAVVVRDTVHVFYLGANQGIYHCWKESNTVRWEPCMGSGEGAPLAAGNPAAAALSTLDVFYRGTQGELFHLWFDGKAWQWEQWAGRGFDSPASVGDPAVALQGEQSALQLFYRDSCGNINHVWKDWNGPQWAQWGDGAPPEAVGDPVTMVTSGGVMHVFYCGGDDGDDIIHIWWDVSFQQDQWTGLPRQPQATGVPATLVTSDGVQHMFYRGTDESICHAWYDTGKHWEPWTRGGSTLHKVADPPGNPRG